MKFIKSECARFLVAGSTNTAFTYLIYLAALQRLGYVTAFTLSFFAGIVFSFIIYSRFVFRSPLILKKFFQYPIIYVFQYISGLILLIVLIKYMGIDKNIAPFVNVILLAPVIFVLNKFFLSKKAK